MENKELLQMLLVAPETQLHPSFIDEISILLAKPYNREDTLNLFQRIYDSYDDYKCSSFIAALVNPKFTEKYE